MTFSIQNGMLAGLGIAAAVIPILIHLLLRQQPKRVVFPAIRLLRNRRMKVVNTLRLRHLLLLALRIAALALLGLALGRPALHSTGLIHVDQEAPVAAVMIFDTSPSMDLKFQGKTRLELAKELGKQVLDRLAEQSQIVVIDTSVPTSHVPIPYAAARDRIDKLEITAGQRPIGQAIEAAFRSLSKTELSRGEVYVFSDLAGHAWNNLDSSSLKNVFGQITASTTMYVLDLSAERPRNISLAVPKLSEQVVTVGSAVNLTTTVQNLGPEADLVLEVELDGQSIEQRPIKLRPDTIEDFRLRIPITKKGTSLGSVRIKTNDALPFDDQRYFAVEGRASTKVLVIANTDLEARFWLNALEPAVLRGKESSRFAIELSTEPAKALERDLAGFGAVCVLNVGGISPTAWQRLANYAEAGGGVFFALGDRVDPPSYNSADAQKLLPIKLVNEAKLGQATTIILDKVSHPALQVFARLQRNDFGLAYVVRYWKVTANPGSSSILKYANNEPALVERSLGAGSAGKVMVLTIPVSYTPTGYWSELPRRWSFVPFAEQSVRYLARLADVPLNYVVGTPMLAELPAAGVANQLAVIDPKKEVLRIAVEDAKAISVKIPAAKWAGHYRVESENGPNRFSLGYAANIPDSESNLEPVKSDFVKQILDKDKVNVARDLDSLQKSVTEDRVGRELFPYLMVLLLLVISVESFFANRFYKKDAVAQEQRQVA